MQYERNTSKVYVVNELQFYIKNAALNKKQRINDIFVTIYKFMNCYCGNNLPYAQCCEPYHLKIIKAPTAEILMRSRYSAFVVANADYLYETTHFSKRKTNSKTAYLSSAKKNKWLKLEIINASSATVEFKAYYLNNKLQVEILHEKSNFKLEEEQWYYVDGDFY